MMALQPFLFLRDEATCSVLLKAFVILQMVGLVGCAFTLATTLVFNVQRHPTWISFMSTWSISAVSYLLLFLSGQLDNPDPPFKICLAQATLIYAAPLLTAGSTLALVAQVHSTVRNMFSGQLRRERPIGQIILLILPYLFFTAMAITCVMLGLHDRDIVRRESLDFAYCHLRNRIPSKVASTGVAAMMLPSLVLEGMVCHLIWKNRAILKGRRSSISTAIRVMSFLLLGLVSIGLSILFATSNERDPEMNLVLALLPAGAFLLFGTQTDIFRAWIFWQRPDPLKSDTVIASSKEPIQAPRHYSAPSA